MSLLAPIRRRAALLAVLCGFSVFAAALGGMTSVDANLRAVAPLDTSELVRVSDAAAPRAGCDRESAGSSGDLAREL